MKNFILYIFSLLFIVGCARPKISDSSQAMRLLDKASSVSVQDDLNYKDLSEQILANIQQLSKSKKTEMVFGELKIKKESYIESLRALQKAIEDKSVDNSVYIEKNFQLFEVYGAKEWGDVYITSYFEPVISGSRKKTTKHSQALYAVPKDMAIVKFSDFLEAYPRLIRDPIRRKEIKNKKVILRARTHKTKNGSLEISPYYSRAEMQENKINAKVLAWVDPVDAFFMQIQGSGSVAFSDGKEILLGYAGQNGHKYEAIGKYLFDVIPKEEMSMQRIESHLRSLTPEESQELLNKNPSYVFFQKLKAKPITYFGTEVFSGRTIATDKFLFPKGALGLLQFPDPTKTQEKDQRQQLKSRIVFDHDTGGAIRGPARVDLFWGRGAEAKEYAGRMKHWGKLYYLVPK